jgi:hypothetical protein
MILDRFSSIVANVNNIAKILDSYQQGSVILQAGKNVIEISTRKPPAEVWVSIKNSGGIPVCQGNLDKISYTISDVGFILYAEVISDVLEIQYNVFFDIPA